MLRATRRLLRPDGRTAFTTIHLPANLGPGQRRRALVAGPSAAATRSRDYPTLLASAGFVDIEQVDVTAAYHAAGRRWVEYATAFQDELAPLEPPGRFAERLEEQSATLDALDDGLLARSMFVARRA